jgi:hypothetical protein
MKIADISPTASSTTRIGAEITDPKIAERPTTVSPLAIAVGESAPNNIPEMDIPTPPVYSRGAPSTVRSGLSGEHMPGIDATSAPSSDPRYNPTATELRPRPSSLPMQVSAAQVARESLSRMYNIGPSDSELEGE